jgi:putative membrane protein
MHWHRYGYDWSAWPMVVLMILFWVALIVTAVLLVRAAAGRQPAAGPPHPAGPGMPGQPGADPQWLLAERFARGDIDEGEYRRRLAVLRGDPAPEPPPAPEPAPAPEPGHRPEPDPSGSAGGGAG